MANRRGHHETVEKDGYELTFYPGFVSRCGVRLRGKREKVLYRQAAVVDVHGGEPERSRVRLRGGPNERDFTLSVEDPKHEIARITVELHPRGHVHGRGEASGTAETVTIDEDPFKCPPFCGQQIPENRTGAGR